MRKRFARYLSGDEWIFSERGWDLHAQNVREAQCAIGNGFLGCRGSLEEKPPGAWPGTYLAGFYDRTGSLVAELVNLPNPFRMQLALSGEKLGIAAMDWTSHVRHLDLKRGLLVRHTLYRDTRRRKYDYQSLRFVSMHDRNIGVMQVYLTALDGPADLTVTASVDTAVYTSGTVTEGRKKHWSMRAVSHRDDIEYIRIMGLDTGFAVTMASCVIVTSNGKTSLAPDPVFPIHLKKGKTVCLTKIFVVHPSGDQRPADMFKATTTRLQRAMKQGFRKLTNNHIKKWEDLWTSASVTIKGAATTEHSLRFSTYHLLCCAPAPGSRCNIGAKALTGDGYRGHVFWDSDIFILPFFVHVMPLAAVDMLLYRYDRLNAAREIAKRKHYRGAMYPWESAATGEEETPAWAKGLDGKVIRIHTHDQEYHITADVAYAVYQYYTASGDDNFMLACGFEMLFETARFWASRVEYNARRKLYEIKNVIGPDEFHEGVNNNAYTNMMAKWNLLIANRMAILMKLRYRSEFDALSRRINLKSSEVKSWKQIAPRVSARQRQDGVIEEFNGYWRLRRLSLTRNEYGIPVTPKGFRWSQVHKTQLVKQADVVMLLHLLSDIYGLKTKRRNFIHYEPRTVHKSSLSPAMHAIAAAEIGNPEAAYKFFQVATSIDYKNLYGNTADGIHAAALGGIWQAAVHGFGGLHIRRGTLHITPRLPKAWKSLGFCYWWEGNRLQILVDNKKVRISRRGSQKGGQIRIVVYGRHRSIAPHKTAVFYK